MLRWRYDLGHSRSGYVLGLVFIGLALWGAIIFALSAVGGFERYNLGQVERAMAMARYEWVLVEPDGIRVWLRGTAPSEEARFEAFSAAKSAVKAAQIFDAMQVVSDKALRLPLQVDILRNASNVLLIGVLPKAIAPEKIVEKTKAILPDLSVVDMLENTPHGHEVGIDMLGAIEYGITALGFFEQGKVSIRAGEIVIDAAADNHIKRDDIQSQLAEAAPENFTLRLDIRAPRPVVRPYLLRATKTRDGFSFDTCVVDTLAGRTMIEAAGRRVGLSGVFKCEIAIGAFSSDWADVASEAITSLGVFRAGELTLRDGDVTLIVEAGASPEIFDEVTTVLRESLPEAYILQTIRLAGEVAVSVDKAEKSYEFFATLSPEGLLRLGGKVPNEESFALIDALAKAYFGSENVYNKPRIDETLPKELVWDIMAGLEALSYLDQGILQVDPGFLEIRAKSYAEDAGNQVREVLVEKLGSGAVFELAIGRLKQKIAIAAPARDTRVCVAQVNELLEEQKISFDPGNATISQNSFPIIDMLARVLIGCNKGVEVEIGGHTDAQGSAEMNQRLSKNRAYAVLRALLHHGVDTRKMVVQGYGETDPIADNATQEGREENRRITFSLIPRPDKQQDKQTEQKGQTDGQN